MIRMSEALEPLRRTLEAGHEPLVEKPLTDLPYDGYAQGPSVLHLNVDFDDMFGSEYRKRKAEEHLTLVDITLQAAFQLGFEQGTRYERQHRIPHMLSHSEFLETVLRGVRNVTMDETGVSPAEWNATERAPYLEALTMWIAALEGTENTLEELRISVQLLAARFPFVVTTEKLFHGIVYALASNKALILRADKKPFLLSLESVE